MQVMDGPIDQINSIAKRDIERKLEVQKRKEDRNNLTAANEKLSYFQETFTTKHTYVTDLIDKSLDLEKAKLPDHFNEISKEILLLQKYVAASNIFLRTYDIQKCQKSLQDLTNKSKELEDELMPKKKFGFRSKSQKPKLEEPKPAGKDEPDFRAKNTFTPIELCGFSSRRGEVLVMKGADIHKRDIAAENLQDCTVKFLGSPSTLHLNGLRNCRVFTGPISTSIFADNCVDCTLVIACQQLRLHSSTNVNIYLHVTSRAIMEDCRDIFLAPYNFKYNGQDEDFAEAGLDVCKNNWKCVDDFNWLNLERRSPHWSLLDEEKIVKSWANM